jgi:hypothetical protein
MKRALEMSGLAGLQDRMACWFARHKLLREFDVVGADETERLMHDLGLSISDMAAIARPHAGPEMLLPQRLEALGLDPLYLKKAERATYRDLEAACSRCSKWRVCARDLARGDVQAGMDSYCLNGDTLDHMLASSFSEAAKSRSVAP